jgi:hypothetical protein
LFIFAISLALCRVASKAPDGRGSHAIAGGAVFGGLMMRVQAGATALLLLLCQSRHTRWRKSRRDKTRADFALAAESGDCLFNQGFWTTKVRPCGRPARMRGGKLWLGIIFPRGGTLPPMSLIIRVREICVRRRARSIRSCGRTLRGDHRGCIRH